MLQPIVVQIIDPVSFCNEVCQTVLDTRLNYIDAILHICEKRSIEPEMGASLINPALREAIRVDAVRLNKIKKTASLPF